MHADRNAACLSTAAYICGSIPRTVLRKLDRSLVYEASPLQQNSPFKHDLCLFCRWLR